MNNGYKSGSQIIFDNENLYSTNRSYNQDVDFTVDYGQKVDTISEAVNSYSLALSMKTNKESIKKRNRKPIKFEDNEEIFNPIEDCSCTVVDNLHKKKAFNYPQSEAKVLKEIKTTEKSYGFFQKTLVGLFD
jgi:Na+/phosphate symporter